MLSIETRADIERRALEITRHLDREAASLTAEIDPDHPAAWYALVTAPDAEARASRHLVRRSFGLFDPMFDEVVVVRGARRIKRTRLLPGYLLVYVWNIRDQWARITTCPGIADIVRRVGTNDPAVIPDEMVSYLQGRETIESLNNTQPGWAGTDEIPTRKQARYKRRKNGSRVKEPVMVTAVPKAPEVIIRCKSYLSGIEELAPDERISLFAKALGLGS